MGHKGMPITTRDWTTDRLSYFNLSLRHCKRRIASSGMLRRVALVRADVSEELSASIIKVTRIGEL
jgi:hypothetical protein